MGESKQHGAAMHRFDHAVLEGFPRVQLALLPTPIEELKRFSRALGGPRIFVKRDDQTGLAGGGNKTRKLEFLMGDALSKGADCVITAGAVQSNHCRQTAAAAAKLGLTCHLVFGGTPPSTASGNFLFDQLLGANFHFTEKHLRNQKMESLAEALRAEGKSPYIIPVGGSNHIGALGYLSAMIETRDQLEALNLTIDHLIFATSSGGTQAGLVLGAKLCSFNGVITGISIDQVPDEGSEFKFKAFVHDIVKDLERAIKIPNAVDIADLKIDYGYLGKGYGVVGPLECGAVRLLAGKEGLLVGPVYTGRALGALMDYVKTNKIGPKENVLFIHTGDDIALHAYADEMSRS